MTPRIARSSLAIGTAVAAAALLASGLTGPATAAEPAPGAAPLKLSADARADLLKDASAGVAKTADTLGLGSQEKLVVRDVIKDRDGTTHTRYERTYAGLPVLGGDLVVHEAKSGAQTVTKATSADIAVDTSPGLSAAAAPKGARKVVWAAKGTPKLAYEAVKNSIGKDGTPSELHTVTDAVTGKKLSQWDGVQNGTGKSQFSGTVTLNTTKSGSTYQLIDGTRGNHKTYTLKNSSSGTGTLLTDADDVWGSGTVSDPATAGVDAAYGAAKTWDYYKDVFGRSGIRGDGVGATSRVHYGNNYVNAFWQDSCFCMTYGDGAGNKAPLTALDVAAHEMSHGVTAATANLNYSGESGGLNEATSDIFATAVEFHAANAADPGDYLIGEKIDINGDGSPLRYMDKPSKDGASQDSWSSRTGSVDVHYSSGVANHFFYLLSEGSGKKTINGVNYDSPTSNGATVTGIGRAKAEQIWYKALTTYMTSTTNYARARTATLSAAGALYGTTSAEYKAVGAAWAGVNVN
ncbi:M4 family metallopeptidase [Streptomyces tsukubensis]|uniref:Neutral metalloproteinase n=1 Tax=Streptomyces tsukubensis TaxID=83656 RepID=A0A1V4A8R7_9ACTN|nr:M4 family metallopeptidase [Streptomyces tsukubensis]OON79611.1 peptidase M4 family protein [Streptomyces tsukubensis]